MRVKLYILSLVLLTVLPACRTTIVETPEPVGTDLMRFTIVRESDQAALTRASQPLTTGFMVSCYNHYDSPLQQTVMSEYEVQYITSGTAWDGTIRPYWRYDQVGTQYLHYWNLSAFPYRFHAVAPYPSDNAGFVLSDSHLTIPTPYYAQTCTNGLLTPASAVAEPYLVAQVQRGVDGTDHDLLVHDPAESEINNGSANKVRDVWLPFHHLNSKIRFGVFHTTAWLTANKVYIEDMTISVASPQFAIGATGYQADGTSSWRILTGNAGFTGVTTATDMPHPIFRYGGGPEIVDNDLRECQTRQTAYFLQCPDGMMQIPQENVQMAVSFVLRTEDGELYKNFENIPVRIEIDDAPGTYQYYFDWQSGYIYTYYLIIGEIDEKLEITFTATLTPWEDVTGNLSTDLEK